MKILELFSQKGYENWQDFSLLIKTKTAEEIEEFFYQKLVPFLYRRKGSKKEFVPLKQRINKELSDVIEKAKKLREEKQFEKTTFFGEHLGHMTLRDEFEFEHENEAEILLSEIINRDDDTQEDEQLKFNLLELYNRRIKERNKRREFLIQRDKLDFEKTLKDLSRMNQMEKEIRFEMMKVERFFDPKEFDEFQNLVLEDSNISVALEQLKILKEKGFETIDDF